MILLDKVADFISTCDVADRCVTCCGTSTPIFGLADHARCCTAMHDENSFEYKVHRAMDEALDAYRFRPEGLMMDEYNRMACKHDTRLVLQDLLRAVNRETEFVALCSSLNTLTLHQHMPGVLEHS